MRIIRGDLRGRQIHPPKNFKARPTTDIAKEGLFNVLENNYNFQNIRVMDAFSGTGSISYEFASRGCLDITALEKNTKYASYIRTIAEELKILQLLVINTDIFKTRLSAFKPFDIIFADPPFDLSNLQDIPNLFLNANILTPEGWLIVEHSKTTNFSSHPNLEKQKKYGKVLFSFFTPSI